MVEDLVSIITPVYNTERFITDTINSVLNQTYQNWEMLLVDDCSSDNSAEIVKKFVEQDARIKYIKLDKNAGVANARNVGMKKATGEYIAFLDSDDMWDANKLTKQIKFMKDNKYHFTYTAYEIVDPEGKPLNKAVGVPTEVSYKDLLKQNIIGCLTVVVKSHVIKDLEMPKLKHEDFAFWLSIIKKGTVARGLNENLAKYRKLDDSLSANKFKTIGWMWNIYRKHEKLNLIESLNYQLNFIIRKLFKYQKLGLMHSVFRKVKES